MEQDFAGYISSVYINGKRYKLQCEVIEAHPITCKRCGAPLELKYGEGKCEHCGTYYTTRFIVEEKDVNSNEGRK